MKAIAGSLGLIGVILGALGAHTLKARLIASNMDAAWQTAVNYQLVHSVALLAILGTGFSVGPCNIRLAWAVRMWVAGVLLFSGSLYILALGGPRWLGPVTPFGGLFLMAGWGCVIASHARSEHTPRAPDRNG